jgi:predicted nuclease with TOPRIM domain
VAIEEKDFELIEEFLKNNLSRIISDQGYSRPPVVYEIELRERMVRVEEELKNQRELMMKGFEMSEKRFEQVDKRFEQVDKRFEQVDRRFEQMDRHLNDLSSRMFHFMIWSFGFTATAAGIIIAVLKLT